jgi:hypothetical protein
MHSAEQGMANMFSLIVNVVIHVFGLLRYIIIDIYLKYTWHIFNLKYNKTKLNDF